MISRLYSVYDVKAVAFAPPFVAATDGIAVRMLSDLVQDRNTTVGRHPEDFRLFCIGTFDDQRAVLLGTVPAEHVVDALALVSGSKLSLEEAAQ